MSQDDDIFLKTFNEMIELLKDMNNNLVEIKKSVEVVLPSIDGVGAGITNMNTQIIELKKQIIHLSDEILEISTESIPESKSRVKSKSPAKEKKSETKETMTEPAPVTMATHTTPQHPIFIDTHNKVNESSKFKEIGEILIAGLEQIETNFSFSRVFYEIRRVGNSLIRKGQKDIPPKEKLEILEKLLDWESRVSE